MPGPDLPAGRHRAPEGADQGRRLWRGIVSLVILMVLVAALLAAVPGLRDVADRLSDVDPWWIVLAALLEVLSCAGYVLVFQQIFRRAQRRFAARVALSEMAFGAVLPVGGAGGIAIGAWIVKAKGGPVRRFAERSAVLFLLTSAVNVCTLVLAGLLVGLRIVPAPHPVLLGLVPAAVGVAALAAFLAIPRLARRFGDGEPSRWRRWLGVTAGVVEECKAELRAPSWRLAGAVVYLWADIAMMWVCFRALGDAPPLAALTLAFLIGYLGNVVPIPGGIGALDGGLPRARLSRARAVDPDTARHARVPAPARRPRRADRVLSGATSATTSRSAPRRLKARFEQLPLVLDELEQMRAVGVCEQLAGVGRGHVGVLHALATPGGRVASVDRFPRRS